MRCVRTPRACTKLVNTFRDADRVQVEVFQRLFQTWLYAFSGFPRCLLRKNLRRLCKMQVGSKQILKPGWQKSKRNWHSGIVLANLKKITFWLCSLPILDLNTWSTQAEDGGLMDQFGIVWIGLSQAWMTSPENRPTTLGQTSRIARPQQNCSFSRLCAARWRFMRAFRLGHGTCRWHSYGGIGTAKI